MVFGENTLVFGGKYYDILKTRVVFLANAVVFGANRVVFGGNIFIFWVN